MTLAPAVPIVTVFSARGTSRNWFVGGDPCMFRRQPAEFFRDGLDLVCSCEQHCIHSGGLADRHRKLGK